MVIRTATPEDAERLARLNAIVQDLHVAHRPDQFKTVSADELAAWFRTLLGNPRVHMWIAEEDGVPIGFVSAGFHDRPATPFTPPRRWCEMDQIAVDPEWRGKGIGQALMRTLVEKAQTEGVRHIETASWSFNEDAHQVFERFGFRPKLLRFELILGDERGGSPQA
jgi:GNAT superfamily N-acetyltransferase